MQKKESITASNKTSLVSIKFSIERQTLIREISERGIAAKGQALLIKSHKGERLSASQAIKAKCYDCMAFFQDGKGDCGDPLCPLYNWMPYGQVK